MDGTLDTEPLATSPDQSENSVTTQPESGPSTSLKDSSPETLIPLETPSDQSAQTLLQQLPTGAALGISENYKWKPGQSGNPLGKPKGTKNRITLLKLSLEQMLREDASEHMQEVLAVAIKKAKKGDNQMIKLLLELHMSKSGDVDDRHTDDKITININQMPKEAVIEGTSEEVINV
jgi:hypothetical protein